MTTYCRYLGTSRTLFPRLHCSDVTSVFPPCLSPPCWILPTPPRRTEELAVVACAERCGSHSPVAEIINHMTCNK